MFISHMNYQQLFYVYTHSSTHRTKFIRLFIYSQKLISWLFNDLPRRECADVGHKRTIGRPAKMAWKKNLGPQQQIIHQQIIAETVARIRFYLHKDFRAAEIRFYLHKEIRAAES